MSTAWHADELSKVGPPEVALAVFNKQNRHCGISIFEEEQPYLLQRHSSADYVHATKNIALTVRSVSTVGK
jgi:hypothetical protein